MSSQIIHIDVTNFPIAVERVIEPALRARPIVIAIETVSRALVYAASEEAQRLGIFRGQPLEKALKLCRDLLILPPNEKLYWRASGAVVEVLNEFTPVLEPLRFGHAYLDMTGTTKIFGGVSNAAFKAQKEIKKRLQLDAYAGIASNKLVSKVASDYVIYHGETPGLHDVPPGDEETFLAPLRVTFLPGINKKVLLELNDLNVHVNRELAAVEVEHLQMVFGRFGLLLHQRARGIDRRPVQPAKQAPEIVETEQLDDDTNDFYFLQSRLFALLALATRRLREKYLHTRRLVVHIQYSDFKEDAAQQACPPLNTDIELAPVLGSALEKALTRRVRVRKLTLRLADLSVAPLQLSLFEFKDPKIAAVTRAMDKIRDKFGDKAINFGRAVRK